MRGPSKNVIPMILLGWVTLFLNLIAQASSVPSIPAGILNPKETTQLEKASSINSRIKVYMTASTRIQKSIHEAAVKGEFETIPASLKHWTSLLTASLADIEINLQSKKKARELIKYEIQVRKSIAALEDDQIRAPLDQHDDFDACLMQAEKIRKKFVDILFPH
jgi:hypothetical protein